MFADSSAWLDKSLLLYRKKRRRLPIDCVKVGLMAMVSDVRLTIRIACLEQR